MASNIIAISWAPPRPEVYRFASGAQATCIYFESQYKKRAMQYGIAPSDQLALRSLLSVALSSVAGKRKLTIM